MTAVQANQLVKESYPKVLEQVNTSIKNQANAGFKSLNLIVTDPIETHAEKLRADLASAGFTVFPYNNHGYKNFVVLW